MHECLQFINHDERLRFQLHFSTRRSNYTPCIFCDLGSRGFCLLLTQGRSSARHSKYPLGVWIDDFVECITCSGWPDGGFVDYRDISADLLLLLFDTDGPDMLVDAAGEDPGFFVQLAHLVNSRSCPGLAHGLKGRFGSAWRKHANHLLEEVRESESFVFRTLDPVKVFM